jgi:hypothetical protein
VFDHGLVWKIALKFDLQVMAWNAFVEGECRQRP